MADLERAKELKDAGNAAFGAGELDSAREQYTAAVLELEQRALRCKGSLSARVLHR